MRSASAPAGGLETTPAYDPGCVVCPNATLVAAVEQAIRDDVITWHAFPFNAEPELLDASLLSAGIDSVHALDARFNKPLKTVMSQRDVPGMTRGVVPVLQAKGVQAFSLGCNSQIQPPATPGKVFNWVDQASGSKLVVMVHPRGYGFEQASNDAKFGIANRLGKGDPCPTMLDVVSIPDFDEALLYMFKDDNQGPPNTTEVTAAVACAAALFEREGVEGGSSSSSLAAPAADVTKLIGSSFDAFIASLLKHPTASSALPTLTSEIGDVWIYGAQSDPFRAKMARLLMRERTACIAESQCNVTDAALTNFTRLLLKTSEHTFGLHTILDQTVWQNVDVAKALEAPGTHVGAMFATAVASWAEQREYIDHAVNALDANTSPAAVGSPSAKALAASIAAAIDAATPTTPPQLHGFVKLTQPSSALESKHFTFAVDAETGGLSTMVQKKDEFDGNNSGNNAPAAAGRQEWVAAASAAGQQHPPFKLFQFVYKTMNEKYDLTEFRNNITGNWATFNGSWFEKQPGKCYTKVNLDNATCGSAMGCAESHVWLPESVAVYVKRGAGSNRNASKTHTKKGWVDEVVVEMTMGQRAHTVYGAPQTVWTTLSFPTDAVGVDVGLQWAGKTATRLPEVSMLAMPLAPCSSGANSSSSSSDTVGTWKVNKVGSWVDPMDVVPGGGGSHLHAVGDGGAVRKCSNHDTVNVVAFDTALVSVGRATAFPTPATPLSTSEASAGLYHTLHNNLWDTNYPFLYPFEKKTASDKAGVDSFRFKVWWG